MIDLFNFFYRLASGKHPLLLRWRVYSVLRFIVRYVAHFLFPIFFRAIRSGVVGVDSARDVDSSKKVVVSLTSFPARIDRTWLAVETLLRQSYPADAIVLWLSQDQFPSMAAVPRSLLKLRSRGLRIEIRNGDLRSHKKYVYALKEFPDANLILVDDDIYYPSRMIENLVKASELNRGRVICRFTRRIVWRPNGDVLSYRDWPVVNTGSLGRSYFFGSGGGVLIPPGAISSDAVNKDVFCTVAPYADDVWLNAMCRLVNNEFYSLNEPFVLLPVLNDSAEDLSSINNGLLLNDVQIKAVRGYCILTHGSDPFCFAGRAEVL